MNKEQILNVMDHVDPALIEGMEGRRAKKRLPPITRTGLIAACLCAVLVGTAAAAGILGVRFVDAVSNKGYSAYGIFAEVRQWPMSELGQDLQNDVAKGILYTTFSDRKDMVDYLGVPLLYNDLWESSSPLDEATRIHYTIDGNFSTDGVELVSGENAEQFLVSSWRIVRGAAAMMTATVFTEYADSEVLAEQLCKRQWYGFGNVDFSDPQYHDMANGDQAMMITAVATFEETGGTTTHHIAHFVHQGVLYSVCLYEGGGDLALLRQILDAFEIKETP